MIDWTDPKFTEYRYFSVKSIRDIFFSLLNQSKCQARVCETEANIVDIWKKCELLTEECKRLDTKIA